MKKYIIEGRYLLGPMVGMKRYMTEILNRIDILADFKKVNIIIAFPSEPEENEFKFSNIKKVITQSASEYASRNGAVYVSMSNGICRCRNGIICVHDIIPLQADGFSLKHKIHIFLNMLTVKLFARSILTVSETSKNAICRLFWISPSRVTVTYSGWEHLNNINGDDTVLHRLNLLKEQYYYSVGSVYPYKNYKWIFEAAERNPDCKFVITGSDFENFAKKEFDLNKSANVVFTGYITDSENKALMENCKALIHPSKAEGFGLPPLEALALGRPVILSDASCLPEIYQDCAHYFDPDEYNINLGELLKQKVENPQKLLSKYSWDKAAFAWLNILEK